MKPVSKISNLKSVISNLKSTIWNLSLAVAIVALGEVAYAQGTLRIVPLVRTEQVIVSVDLDNGYTDEVRQVINGGVRTTFTYDVDLKMIVPAWVDRTIATAVVTTTRGYPVTINDPALTERMVPTLRRTLGAASVIPAQQTTTAEDFSLFQRKVPGMFFFLGVTPKGADPRTVAPNHSPRFFADEAALVPGMRAVANLAVDYLFGAAKGTPSTGAQ